MIISRYCIIMSIGLFLSGNIAAQKKIVVLGSSSAEGTGATTFDSSWVGRVYHYFNLNTSDGVDTIMYNLAVGGYTSYHVMPTGFTPPGGRPSPDPLRNITAALSYSPDVILVNLPSNDIFQNYTVHEVMDNFRQISTIAGNAGVRFFITTSQPRDDDPPIPVNLKSLKDSIIASFPLKYIDFWSDLVSNDGLFHLLPEVGWGDGVHINNLGHFYVANRVIAKGIFTAHISLPVQLISFNAIPRKNTVQLTWTIEQEEPYTIYTLEESNDGIHFTSLDHLDGSGGPQQKTYTWTDYSPSAGTDYYRIHITENNNESYSKTIPVNIKYTGITLSKLYCNPGGDQLNFHITSASQQAVSVRIVNPAGAVVWQQSRPVNQGIQSCNINVSNLAGGLYYLQVLSENNEPAAAAFMK